MVGERGEKKARVHVVVVETSAMVAARSVWLARDAERKLSVA
jgi:hypothetical protein